MDERYLRYWSDSLGAGLAAQEPGTVTVVPHLALGGYHGAWIFEMLGRLVLSVPPQLVPTLRGRAESVSPTLAGCEQAFASLAVTRRIGPAVHMGIDAAPATIASVIRAADDAAIAVLRAAVPAEEWDDASIDEDRARGAPVLAAMVGDEIAALASYGMLPGRGANPGIAVHPRHRGHGFGKAALAAITKYCRQADLLPVLQTLESNHAMVRCAQAIGYRVHARHVALRLDLGI
ncbi:MAG TPA: GNAT family N-acetyltransferase [Microvirga sp.]|nr:GNAT family N-acetyltransferase [Microvirga sp.]